MKSLKRQTSVFISVTSCHDRDIFWSVVAMVWWFLFFYFWRFHRI